MPVFDGHNDLLLKLWLSEADNPVGTFLDGSLDGHLDMLRIRQGNMVGGLFAVFILPQNYLQKMSLIKSTQPYDPLAITQAQIALLQQIEAQSAGRAKICRTVAEIEACISRGVLAMVLHIEGAEALDAELTLLDSWYDAGLRSIGPMWNLPNQFGFGVSGEFPGSPA